MDETYSRSGSGRPREGRRDMQRYDESVSARRGPCRDLWGSSRSTT